MNPSRCLRGLMGALFALSLLMILAQALSPERSSASPPLVISKPGGPGDPGTPYEEPENDPTGPADPKPPDNVVGSPGGAPIDTPTTTGPGGRRQIDRRWLSLSLQAWRIQLQILLRF